MGCGRRIPWGGEDGRRNRVSTGRVLGAGGGRGHRGPAGEGSEVRDRTGSVGGTVTELLTRPIRDGTAEDGYGRTPPRPTTVPLFLPVPGPDLEVRITSCRRQRVRCPHPSQGPPPPCRFTLELTDPVSGVPLPVCPTPGPSVVFGRSRTHVGSGVLGGPGSECRGGGYLGSGWVPLVGESILHRET